MLRVWQVWVDGQDTANPGLVVYARSAERAGMLAEASTGRFAILTREATMAVDPAGPRWISREPFGEQ